MNNFSILLFYLVFTQSLLNKIKYFELHHEWLRRGKKGVQNEKRKKKLKFIGASMNGTVPNLFNLNQLKIGIISSHPILQI